MTSTASTYVYTPLPSGTANVRVLTLYPSGSNPDNEIEISLEIVRFASKNAPRFEALSYVWGSRDDPVGITVTDKVEITVRPNEIGNSDKSSGTLYVTRNLAVALKHLRYENEARVMWIDAICIDQSNLVERSQQVKIMGRIYRHASPLVVWLGPEAENSGVAIECLTDLGSKVEVDWMTFELYPSAAAVARGEVHWADKTEELPWDETQIRALELLCARGYFERLWVVQEVVLANSSAVVVCGSKTTTWKAVRDAMYALHQKDAKSPLSEWAKRRLEAIELMFNPTRQYSLTSTLDGCQLLDCEDAKDKIYAVLGMASDAPDVMPDYTRPVGEVYQDLVQVYVQTRYAGLNILDACELTDSRLDGLPTWVPDWSKPKMSTRIDAGNAALAAKPDAIFDGKSLRLSAIKCATITKVESIIISEDDTRPDKVIREVKRLAPPDLLTAAYTTGCSLLEAFSCSLAASLFPGCEPPRPSSLTCETAMATARSFLGLEEAEINVNSSSKWSLAEKTFATRFSNYGRGRTLVSTDRGYIGMAPGTAREGDVVCALIGSEPLTVLRPTATGAGNQFQVVGECFVYGLMCGESILGPLPKETGALWNYHEGRNWWDWAYRDVATGHISWDDPRPASLGIDMEQYDPVHERPPLISVEALKGIGADISYLELI